MKVRTRLTEALFDKEKAKAMGAMLDRELAKSKDRPWPDIAVGDTVEMTDVHQRMPPYGRRCKVTKVSREKNYIEVDHLGMHFQLSPYGMKKVG